MNKNDIISTITKNNRIHFYKKLNYNNRNRYKKIEYLYDILDKNGDVIESKRHNALNKPSIIVYHNSKIIKLEYWYKGERHRNWAPAIIELNGKEIVFESWYHFDEKLDENKIEKIQKILARRKKVLKLMIRGIQKKKGII